MQRFFTAFKRTDIICLLGLSFVLQLLFFKVKQKDLIGKKHVHRMEQRIICQRPFSIKLLIEVIHKVIPT